MDLVERLGNANLNAPSDAFFWPTGWLIQLWNAGAVRIFGFAREEAIGQSLDLIIPERRRARHWPGYEHVMATARPATAPARSCPCRR